MNQKLEPPTLSLITCCKTFNFQLEFRSSWLNNFEAYSHPSWFLQIAFSLTKEDSGPMQAFLRPFQLHSTGSWLKNHWITINNLTYHSISISNTKIFTHPGVQRCWHRSQLRLGSAINHRTSTFDRHKVTSFITKSGHGFNAEWGRTEEDVERELQCRRQRESKFWCWEGNRGGEEKQSELDAAAADSERN